MQFEFLLNPRNPRPKKTGVLRVNDRDVPVTLVRSRRARRYVLRLDTDGLARLTVPRWGSVTEAWQFAQRHTAWLERQLRHLAMRPIRPKEWRVGMEMMYRGESLKLEMDGTKICFGNESIRVADITADLRPEIEKHLRALSAKELPTRTLELAALHGLTVRRVTIRGQRSRWGSCSSKGVISLNWRLVHTPLFVRDYIILHELMHLKQMNHSARFWNEVERACPDYRKAKLWLKENPGLLDPA